MKRKFTFLIAAAVMLLTMMATTGVMWGQSDYSTDYEGNITLSTAGGSNVSACTIKIGNPSQDYAGIKAGTSSKAGAVKISVPSGTKYLHLHVAAWKGTSASLTVTPDGYSNDIALTADDGISNNSPFTFSGNPSSDDYYKVITFANALAADTDLTFTAASSGGKRFVIWGVTSEEEGSGGNTPSITANNVNIAYNATQGSIGYTLNNATGNVTAEVTTGDWLTLGTITATEVPFTCSANTLNTARTATVTLSFEGADDKVVTVTQGAAPVVYTTIPTLFEAATGTETSVQVTFNNWVVSGVSTNGKNIFVTDNNGNGFVIYYTSNMSSIFAAGDILSGTAVSCTLKLYNGFAELIGVDADDLTITEGGDVTVANVAMADLTGVNTGALLHYDNLECSVDDSGNSTKYYLTDGTTELQVYNSLYAFDALVDGKTYNITGVYQQYTTSNNNTKEILPRSAGDIEEVVPTVPTITVAPATVNAPVEGAGGTLNVTYENITDIAADVWFCNAAGSEVATYEWITAEINNTTNNVDYIIEQNDGAARTAYFKVWAYDDSMNEVYSNLVTVTQAEYVAPTYATLPFAFDGDKADIENTNGLYQEGLGSDYNNSPKLKFDGTGDWLLLQFSERPGTLTFKIKGNGFSSGSTSTFKVQTSADGTTYTDLVTYTELGDTQTESFDNLDENVRYIKWIYTEKGATSGGNVALGDINLAAYVAPVASITVTPDLIEAPATPVAPATAITGSLTVTLSNITITELDQLGIDFCDENGTLLTGANAKPSWFESEFELVNEEYKLNYTIAANTETTERVAYFKVYEINSEVYSNKVTVTQEAYVAPVATITVYPTSVSATAAETEDWLAITLDNIVITEDGGGEFDVYFCDSEGNILPDQSNKPNWFAFEFSFNDVWSMPYTISANTETTERTLYFKIKGTGDDGTTESFSELVTVTQAGYVVDYATLPFEWEGGTTANFNALNGTSTYSVGDYGDNQGVYRMKLDGDGDYIQIKTNEQPGIVTIGVKMIGGATASTLTVQGSADGVTFTDIEDLTISGSQNTELTLATTNDFAATDRYVRLLFTKGSNVGVGPITIEQVDNTPSITLSSYSVEAPCTETEGSLTVTYKNIATDLGASIYWYEADGTTSATYNWIDADINSSLNVDYMIEANDDAERKAYFKVYGVDNDGNDVYSDLVTVTQAEAQTMHTVTIDAKAYNQGTMVEVPFTGSIDIASTTVATGSEVTITVNCEGSNGTNYRLESFSVVDSQEQPVDITFEKEGYVTTIKFTMPDDNVIVRMGIFQYFNVIAHINGQTVSQEAITTQGFDVTPPAGFSLAGWVWNEEDYADKQTYLTFSDDNQEVWAVFQRRVGGTKNSFVKITTTDELAAGYYLIVCESENVAFNSGLENLDVAGNKIDVEIEDNAIVVTSENVTAYLGIFANQSNGYSIISYSGKYIGKTTDSNGMNTSDTDDYTNSIGFDNDGNADIAGSGGAYLRYNKGVNDTRFRYYKSSTYTSQQPIQLYKYVPGTGGNIEYCTRVFVGTNSMATLTLNAPAVVAKNALLNVTGTWSNENAAYLIIDEGGQLKTTSAVNATVRREIAKAPTWNAKAGNEDGWYTISSPIYGDLTATNVTGLITTGDDSSYDLYKYDEGTSYWINYKGNNYEIEPGTGYLYSSQAGTMIEFSGVINKTNVVCNLTTDGADPLKGFNLIGNPYSHNIYKGYAIPDDKLAEGYYILSKKGGWITKTDDDAIAPTQGILVKATTAGEITLTSTNEGPSAKSNHDNIQFMVSNNQYEDIAYAWFDKGTSLNKISHRNSNIPMIYIPQDGQKYAIATMGDDTEMFNLNLKAMTTGEYTLSFKAEGNYNYLHVIDRFTGEDIDMLLDGEYTFIASPRDDENRFIVKLRYNANGNVDANNIFAYQCGDELIINGNGELQVFDVMGRYVATYNVNGNMRISASQFENAMYIFRLVGSEVMTQKIVVR